MRKLVANMLISFTRVHKLRNSSVTSESFYYLKKLVFYFFGKNSVKVKGSSSHLARLLIFDGEKPPVIDRSKDLIPRIKNN